MINMTRQVILDTETTGLETSKGHRLIEIGCLEMISRRLTGQKFHTYINPEREVDKGAFAISGISTEFLLDKPKFNIVVEEFLSFIEGAELIIHNAPFDIGFINHELSLLNHPWKKVDDYVQIFDTLQLARQLHPGQKNNLDALCKRYGVDNSHRVTHGALLDAEILSKVYLLMTAGQTSMSLEEEVFEENSIGKAKRILKRTKVRPQNVVLKVVRASPDELKLHEAKMHALKGAKG